MNDEVEEDRELEGKEGVSRVGRKFRRRDT
jgi:hypothetical protein